MEGLDNWKAVGALITRSPFSSRRVHGGLPALANLLSPPPEPWKHILGDGLRVSRTVLSALSGQAVTIRKFNASAGDFSMPDAKHIHKYMRKGVELVQRLPMGRLERSAHCGLIALLVHPFADGNGRLFRLILTSGLISDGATIERIEGSLTELYRNSAREFMVCLQYAAGGDWQPFTELWRSVQAK